MNGTIGRDHPRLQQREAGLLHCAVVCFVIAIVAALLGFGGIATGVVGVAQVLFTLFAGLSVASYLAGLLRKR